MKMNSSKTKVVKFSRTNDYEITINVDSQEIENVKEFCYLGVWISIDGRDQKEIKSRIGMVRKAFHNLSVVLEN